MHSVSFIQSMSYSRLNFFFNYSAAKLFFFIFVSQKELLQLAWTPSRWQSSYFMNHTVSRVFFWSSVFDYLPPSGTQHFTFWLIKKRTSASAHSLHSPVSTPDVSVDVFLSWSMLVTLAEMVFTEPQETCMQQKTEEPDNTLSRRRTFLLIDCCVCYISL